MLKLPVPVFPAASVAEQVSVVVPQNLNSCNVLILLNSRPETAVPSSLVNEHVGFEPSNTSSVTVGTVIIKLGPSP